MKLCNRPPLLRINPGPYPQRLLVSMEEAKFQIPMRIVFVSVREQVVLFHIDHALGGEGRQGHRKHPCQGESWCPAPGGSYQVSHPHWEEEAFRAGIQGD